MLKLFLLVCFTVNALVDSIPLDNAVIEERIIGGKDTDISEVPHQIALFIWDNFMSGGAIVSPTHILTAAEFVHLFGTQGIVIQAGSSSKKEGGVLRGIRKTHVHPNYNVKTGDYDVAILELLEPLQLNNKTIKAIKLGTKEPSPGSVALISGWGHINEHYEDPKTLQSVTIPIVDRTKCTNIYKTHNITITPRMICAGSEGKTSFIGDLGGALVYKDEAVALATYGIGGKGKDLPGIYTNIADPEIMKFIKSILKF